MSKSSEEKWVTVRAAIGDWGSTLRLVVIIGAFAVFSVPASIVVALLMRH